jgi:hypothetical protein
MQALLGSRWRNSLRRKNQHPRTRAHQSTAGQARQRSAGPRLPRDFECTRSARDETRIATETAKDSFGIEVRAPVRERCVRPSFCRSDRSDRTLLVRRVGSTASTPPYAGFRESTRTECVCRNEHGFCQDPRGSERELGAIGPRPAVSRFGNTSFNSMLDPTPRRYCAVRRTRRPRLAAAEAHPRLFMTANCNGGSTIGPTGSTVCLRSPDIAFRLNRSQRLHPASLSGHRWKCGDKESLFRG